MFWDSWDGLEAGEDFQLSPEEEDRSLPAGEPPTPHLRTPFSYNENTKKKKKTNTNTGRGQQVSRQHLISFSVVFLK